MKIQTTFLAQLTTREVATLTTTVNETLAVGFKENKPTFTAAELWNIQRRRKAVAIRRFA